MTDVVIPQAPALATIPDVELMQAGTWAISTGEATFTAGDIANAVSALDCPAVRRPVLKLGHVDPRFDGEPAVGWVGSLRTNATGDVLIGDYMGMPAWLGDVAASAYPDRSIEGYYGFTCQLGHTHPFVITAVALLGVSPPGVGTLTSLQDVATLYGVAASSQDTALPFRTLASSGGRMPDRPPVAASTSVEDVRRAYYDGPGSSYDLWIQAVYLDPPQLIICDDRTGDLYRVTYAVGADGTATFEPPVRVRVEYVDSPEPTPAAASRPAAVYASRGDSRPHQTPRAAEPAPGPTPPTTEDTMSDLDKGLRERLGITDDAELDDAALLARLDEQLDKVTDPNPPATVPDGSVVVPTEALAELQAQARAGAGAAEQLRTQCRDGLIDGAIHAGKVMPSRRAHWLAAYDRDPEGTASYLASAEAIIPVTPAGYAGGDPEQSTGEDALYAELFGDEKKVGA